MPTVRLTDAAAKRLTAPPGARIDYFDAAFGGLALRVTGPGEGRPERRTWSLFYRFGGKQRRLTFVPNYPALGLAEARQKAAAAQALIAAGTDPATERERIKAEAARAPDTVSAVVDLFISRHMEAKRRAPRYVEETRRNFRNHVLPEWGERDIKTIARRDVIELLDGITDGGSTVTRSGKRKKMAGGPIAANRVLAAVRALFNFALRRGLIEATPVALVERPGEETARDRVLEAYELRSIWAAAETLGYPFGPYVRLAVLTGQRRQEIARMRWTDLDLETRVWTLAAGDTKAGRAHVVPLSPQAVTILRGLHRKSARGADGKLNGSHWVFTTTGEAPVSGFSKAKPRLDDAIAKARKAAGVDNLAPWTFHDLRRTCATGMGRLGVTRFVIARVLNHADRSITGIYDRHLYLNEKREALEAWGNYVEGLTKPAGANGVQAQACA
jgi:integrase